MSKIIIEIEFEDVQEDDFINHEVVSIKAHGEDGMSPEEMSNLAEGWGQSDYYSVGINNAILEAIDGEVILGKNIHYY